MLLAAMDETEHSPVLTAPTRKLAAKAMEGLRYAGRVKSRSF